jgi:hypothetical protein
MKAETWMTGDEACDAGLGTSDNGETDMDEMEMAADAKLVLASFKNIPNNLRSRLTAVRAQAGNLPPTNQHQQTESKQNMKKIIAALVAHGIACAEDATEETIAAHVTAIGTETKNLRGQIEAIATDRKTRITAVVEAAFTTEKLIAESRKAGLIAIGSASAEGETEVMTQLSELREAKAVKNPRGANPVPRNPNPNGEETVESLTAALDDEYRQRNPDSEKIADIQARLKAKRNNGREKYLANGPLVPIYARGANA